jgi:hypothetical protein
MKQLFIYLTLIIGIFTTGCNQNTSSSESNDQKASKEKSYDDGTYCADVTYYNPNTQKQNEYTLNVEVENGKLTKILWSNGGWLDISHFTPPYISTSGDCSFTSDKGYQYTITINGSECITTDTPEAIEGREGSLTRKQCAELYGASNRLFEAFLKDRKVSADDIINNEECDIMHKSLTSFERLNNLKEKINKGYIQQVFTRTSGYGAVCQSIIVKRYGVLYILEVGQGRATMGLTSFNPNDEDWQEIMIQENPDENKMTVVVVRILKTGNMLDLEETAKSICQ